ncbi:MAG: LacI family DNA-binding transcriptional regulator [Chloroflexota bacterium]
MSRSSADRSAGETRSAQRTGRPRIADVAREAGVSKTAVSFAFNSPDRLAHETADRIRAVAEQLGYTPHPVARMLTQRQTLMIGVLTPQALSVVFSNPFFGAFTEGVATVAEESGYALQFISPLHGSLARAMSRATVDGVVAIGLGDDHPEVEEIRRAGVPIVLVDSTALPEHGSIEVDDVGGARAAAEHVIELGHRDILIIGVEPALPSRTMDPGGVTGRRLRGYRDAIEAIGLEIPDDLMVVGPASIAGGIAALEAAWAAGLRPTAILAMSDAMAIGAMRALREMGLAVPGDVSVVGFDDIDLAQHVDPPLTTVHQPIRRKGEEAVRLLLTVIQGRDLALPEHRLLDTRLIVRGSTGPVRTSRG